MVSSQSAAKTVRYNIFKRIALPKYMHIYILGYSSQFRVKLSQSMMREKDGIVLCTTQKSSFVCLCLRAVYGASVYFMSLLG
jgi:hypothetical protein